MGKNKTMEELLEEALVPVEEQPYEVPENWVWVKSGYVNEIVTGGTPSKKQPEYYGGFMPFVKPNDLEQGRYVTFSDEYLSQKGAEKSRIIPKYSTMICCIGSIGKTGFSMVNVATNQQINSLVPSAKIIPLYTYYYSLSSVFQRHLINNSSATTISIINKSKVSRLPFALPPLPEQQRIVNKIESLFSKIDKATELIEEAREGFENRKAAILAKAFRGKLTRKWREDHPDIESAEVLLEKIKEEKAEGKKKKVSNGEPIEPPYELPEKWKWVKLSEIALVNPKRMNTKDIQDEQICSFIPMISVSDITGEIEIYETRKFKEVRKGYTNFLEGDILFAKITPYIILKYLPFTHLILVFHFLSKSYLWIPCASGAG